MTFSESLSKRILDLCKKHKITVNHLADMSGVWQSTISEIVRGVSKNPQIKTLYQIATGFGMTLSEFLDFPEMNEEEFDDFN